MRRSPVEGGPPFTEVGLGPAREGSVGISGQEFCTHGRVVDPKRLLRLPGEPQIPRDDPSVLTDLRLPTWRGLGKKLDGLLPLRRDGLETIYWYGHRH